MLYWNKTGNYKTETWHVKCDCCYKNEDTKDSGLSYHSHLDSVDKMGWKTISDIAKHYCPNCKESVTCY